MRIGDGVMFVFSGRLMLKKICDECYVFKMILLLFLFLKFVVFGAISLKEFHLDAYRSREGETINYSFRQPISLPST